MMAFQNKFQDFLEAKISTANDVSPNRISQKVDDKYLVYSKLDSNNPLDHDGSLGIKTEYYQLDAYSHKKIDAQNIMKEVVNLLDGFSGYIGDYKVSGIEITSERDNYYKNKGLYNEMIDIRIPYRR